MVLINDAFVRRLVTPPKGKQTKVYDSRLPGFGVRATSGGRKSFFLNYTCNGREGRITIGAYPAWSVAAARERAAAMKRSADNGDDPILIRRRQKSRPTVLDMWVRYKEEILPGKRPRTAQNECSMWERLILPDLAAVFAEDVTPDAVDTLHRKLSNCTPVQANRCMASLRHAFNKAIRWKWVDRNPVAGVALNPEAARDRHLSRAELERFEMALAKRPVTPAVLAIKFIMLTGCRKAEALRAEWNQFDLDVGVWTKPSSHTKQKRAHRTPLSSEAVALLRKAKVGNDKRWVFPGRGDQHLKDPKRTFQSLCREAGIEDYRIHDFRHTFASYLISNGEELTTIGRLLGHTQSATTLRYAHLADGALRRAAESFSTRLEDR